MGVDVWGRGCHGGGGLNCFKAIEHTKSDIARPELSVALFGPAWTWETKEEEPGKFWKAWWADEQQFWVGPDGVLESPSPVDPFIKPALDEPPAENSSAPIGDQPADNPICIHGPFRSISSFFHRRPIYLEEQPFYTTFSPGVGYSWFVEGGRMLSLPDGWTDVDKQTAMGDWLWPTPTFLTQRNTWETNPHAVKSAVHFEDAWLGGSSLCINLSPAAFSDVQSCFPSSSPAVPNKWICISVLSLSLQQLRTYKVRLITKLTTAAPLNMSPVILDHSGPMTGMKIEAVEQLGNGWSLVSASFFTAARGLDADPCVLGLRVDMTAGRTLADEVKIFIGLFSICDAAQNIAYPVVTSLEWKATKSVGNQGREALTISGELKWQVASRISNLLSTETVQNLTSIDDTRLTWFSQEI